jgi:GMP synthase-like glutamine amidotransferase
MADYNVNTVKIYAIVKEEDNTTTETKLILQSTKNGLNFLSGKYKTSDTSIIFGAARIFVKKLYHDTPKIADYFNDTYLYWVKQFTNAEMIKCPDGVCKFVIEIPANTLPAYTNNKLQCLSIDDLRADYPKIHRDFDSITQEIFDIKQFYTNTDKVKNHYAIFNCEANIAWENYYEALYQGWYKNKGEVWKTYHIAEYQFPTEEELKKIQGIVISGSEWSVYDNTIKPIGIFLEKLRNLVRKHPQIKIIGVCFGCQSLASALGGKVEKMNIGGKPMLLMREKLTFLNGFQEKMGAKITSPQAPTYAESLNIIECHGDNVTVLPEGATLYGTSDRCPVEIWGMGNNIICFQGHPEFNDTIMTDKILPEVEKEFADRYDMTTIVRQSEKSVTSGAIDQQILNAMLERFLKEQI